MTTYRKILLTLFGAIFVWSAIGPKNFTIWLAENSGVVVFVPIFLIAARKYSLSVFSETLVFLFLALHVIGAHYTYDKVPFGDTLGEWFGTSRNVYDQLVHFSFGLLIAYPLYEFFTNLRKWKFFTAALASLAVIMAFAALYEVVEWLTAISLHPSDSRGFMGSQGDFWDTQKDIAVAFVGALMTLFITYVAQKIKRA